MGVYRINVHLMEIHLMGVYLTGVHLMGVYLTGVHFIGVYLIGVHLIDVYFMQTVIDLSRSELQGPYCAPQPYKTRAKCPHRELAAIRTRTRTRSPETNCTNLCEKGRRTKIQLKIDCLSSAGFTSWNLPLPIYS
jgi:uncharacterized protein YjbI with pentapeptide repeats